MRCGPGIAERASLSKREDGWGARTRMKDASSTDVAVRAGQALSSFWQCGDLYRLDPLTLETAISDAVLAARVARLTEERLLDRVAYQDRPVRYEYRLTRRGREIWPVLVTVRGWEYRWAGDHREPPARMRHRACGRYMEPVTMVADRLRTFCALGVLRAEGAAYRLTPEGPAFFPVVMTLIGCGQRWYEAPEGPALVSVHLGCGREFGPRLACGECGGRLAERDVLVEAARQPV